MTRITLAALALGTAAALPVLAQTAVTPPAAAPVAAPPLSAIILDFETRGYRVLEVEVSSVWIEVDAINPDGRQIEADVDPVTGATVKEKFDS